MKSILYIIIISGPIFHFCTENVTDPNENTFLLSDTLLVNYQQVYTNSENSISIKFDSLISDGRCPLDVICVWEGDANLRFALNNSLQTVKFNLHTAGNYFNKDTVLLGYHIQLLDVFPYPHTKIEFEKESYQAKIIIDKVLTE